MNTQTFAHAQNITPITDDALIAVNGGGFGAIINWPNTATLDHIFNRGSVTKAAADY